MVAVPENPIVEQRVQARRQKDLGDYLEKYNDLIEKRAQEYGKEILPAWQRVGRALNKAMKDLYAKYGDKDGKLDEKKLYEEERLKLLKKHAAEINKSLKGQTEKLTSNLAYQYTDAFYFTAFATEQTAKVAVAAPVLSLSQVMGVISNPWLPDGKTYSDRIRANADFLALKMKDIVEEAIAQGLSVPETARLIEARTGESYYNAVRLARTELNRAAAQGQSHSFMQNADVLDGKRWNATLDKRTAPKDADNDGKLYPLDYDTKENPGKPGERIPNHPNCRCKWSPVLSALGVSTKERIARGNDGQPGKQYGERVYTKARDYRAYAKERGLPDMDDRLRNDGKLSYLRRGETLEDYVKAVGLPEKEFLKTVTAATVIAEAGTTAVEAAAVFQPAATIKEANSWAAENIPEVAQVDYKDYDLELANETNENLRLLYDAYPEIQGINFVGTAQARNKGYLNVQLEKLKELNMETFRAKGWKDAEIIKMLKSKLPRMSVPGNVMGQATNSTWGDYAGITFNKAYASDYEKLSRATRRSVESQYHPEGTEAPISVLIHEFGHSIDYFLKDVGLRDKYLTPITDEILSMSKREIREQLSEYAATNDAEVIAEAFAEYRLNPNPRKWARKIGEAMEAALEEYRKGL